jgi:hypothetical protein
MGLTNTETTTLPFAPANLRARRIRAAWPSWRAPIVGTRTTGRLALAQNSRADTGEFAILIARAERKPKAQPTQESPQQERWTQQADWTQESLPAPSPPNSRLVQDRTSAMARPRARRC